MVAVISSRTSGTINPIEKLAAWAHAQGAIMVDGARLRPHHPVDVRRCDFFALSAHKMCGPTGVGVLWGGADPRGDGAVQPRRAHVSGFATRRRPGASSPQVRAGTSPIAEAVGLGAAIDTNEVRIEAIEAHEQELAAVAIERLGEIEGVKLYGPPPERRAGIVSFNVEGIHPHDVAQVLDSEGVAIRAGHHCCQPLMTRLGVAATNRASFYLYSVPEEIDRLVDGVQKTRKIFA